MKSMFSAFLNKGALCYCVRNIFTYCRPLSVARTARIEAHRFWHAVVPRFSNSGAVLRFLYEATCKNRISGPSKKSLWEDNRRIVLYPCHSLRNEQRRAEKMDANEQKRKIGERFHGRGASKGNYCLKKRRKKQSADIKRLMPSF
jgi:hypothetical protein